MIKRRYYRAEHAEKDGASDDDSSSSSSDDSDIEPPISKVNHDVDSDVSDDSKDDIDDDVGKRQYPSISSPGHESEESSENELEVDRSGLIGINDDDDSESDKGELDNTPFTKKGNSVAANTKPEVLPVVEKVSNFVLKSKSVFKCKLCPKIVCLNEETLNTHLKSKRHARSEKLLNDGRLKHFLNSEGEEEFVSDDEDGETHAERHARILALAEAELAPKKSGGRQRQRERLKKKKQNISEKPSSGQKKDNQAKKQNISEKPSSGLKKDNRAEKRNISEKPSSGQKKDNRAKRRKKNFG